jgi:TRAP-type C4-dicarboxylate transport system permease small subunit
MPDQSLSELKNTPLEELIFVRIPHTLCGVMFLICIGINIVNVIGRYVFNSPIFWAEEVLVFMVIWMILLMAGSVTYRGAHLNMDLVYSILPKQFKLIINVAVAIALVVCPLFVAFQASKIVALQFRTNAVTAGTEIPLVIPTSALVFGFCFISLAAIVRFRSYLMRGSKFD